MRPVRDHLRIFLIFLNPYLIKGLRLYTAIRPLACEGITDYSPKALNEVPQKISSVH
jgi:hypothetical protein